MMKPNPITHHKIYFSEEEYTNDTLMSFNNFEKYINCLIKEVNLNLCQYSYAILMIIEITVFFYGMQSKKKAFSFECLIVKVHMK